MVWGQSSLQEVAKSDKLHNHEAFTSWNQANAFLILQIQQKKCVCLLFVDVLYLCRRATAPWLFEAAPHVHSNPQKLIKNPLSSKAENESKTKADITHSEWQNKKGRDAHLLFPYSTGKKYINSIFKKNACSMSVCRNRCNIYWPFYQQHKHLRFKCTTPAKILQIWLKYYIKP